MKSGWNLWIKIPKPFADEDKNSGQLIYNIQLKFLNDDVEDDRKRGIKTFLTY